METRRNALLADLARDADIERSDFLVRAGEQLDRFMSSHSSRIRQLGGIVLIDEDPDYLAVAPDGTFRSRSRVFDDSSGQWISETEIIETAAELAEIYNPADILQAFADAEAGDVGVVAGDASVDEADEVEAEGLDGAPRAGADPYAAAADQWAAGQPEVPEVADEGGAAGALYELALDFQDRSQRTEAGLIEQFENAATGLLGHVGTLTIVDDEDEQLTLGVGGFRGRVVPEGEGGWSDITTPDAIVRYYDPTDVFGDLAEAIAEAYPTVTDEDDDEADDGIRHRRGRRGRGRHRRRRNVRRRGRRRGRRRRARRARRPGQGVVHLATRTRDPSPAQPATMRLAGAELIDSREILPGQWLQEYRAPELVSGARAGQFVHVRTGDYSGPRAPPPVLVQHDRSGRGHADHPLPHDRAGDRVVHPPPAR